MHRRSTANSLAATTQGPVPYTVVGVFEDQLDTLEALASLRKMNHPAEQVSVVIRDTDAEEDSPAEHAIAVARAVAGTALEAMGTWLQGLAALIVPDRGTYIVAGPLGAALAGIHTADDAAPVVATASHAITAVENAPGASPAALVNILEDFGFGADEAAYIESRLAAAAPLIGVTAASPADLQRVRRLFADHNAVHIGMTRTDARVVDEARALLAAAPEASSGGDVVVTDAVAPHRNLCGDDGGASWSAALCGREVVDANGAEVGSVDALLADASPGAATADIERDALRYVVVAYGGVLGIGRHRVAVPAGQLDLDPDPARLAITKEVLHHAPAFDTNTPFSRRDEQTVCAYFGCDPYWLTE